MAHRPTPSITAELEEFIDICEQTNVLVQTVRAGPLDLATPAGRAVARTLGAWARYESEHKADRSRRKALELAERRAISGGGARPYGYAEDRRTIIPEEAAIIRELVDRALFGEPLGRLPAGLVVAGVLLGTAIAYLVHKVRARKGA
jgi:site-specific DNA recombinase